MTSLRKRLTSGLLWNGAAAVFTQGATFLTTVALSNIAGIGNFGRYSMIQNTLLSVCGLSSVGMSFTTAKYISEYRSTDKDRAGRLLRFCALITVLTAAVAALAVVAGASTLSVRIYKDPGLTTAMKVGAAFLFFTTVNAYQLGALSGLEAYKSLAVAAAISGVITLVAAVAGFYWFGFTGAVAGQSIGSACRYFLHKKILDGECRQAGIVPKRGGAAGQGQVLFKFALPSALAGYTIIPATWLANALLFRQANGASQVALYTAALTFKTVLLFFPNTITAVTLSVINHTKATTDLSKYLRLYLHNIALVTGVVLLCTIPFLFFGATLLKAFGHDFSAGQNVLSLLILSTIADGITVAAYPLFHSQGRMWLSFWTLAVPRDTIFVALAYYWVPLRGAFGLAQAQLLVSIIVAISTVAFACYIAAGLIRSQTTPTILAVVNNS